MMEALLFVLLPALAHGGGGGGAAVVTARCPDPTDCTSSLQTAFDTAGATLVRVPLLPGNQPWIVGDQSGGPTSIDPRVQANASGIMLGPASSHRTIVFAGGVQVLAKQGAFHHGQFFIGVNGSNITILGRGAVWRMRKRDYSNPKMYAHSEDRHALALYGCSDITIIGLLISSSGGDGIYMTGLTSTGGSDNLMGYCRNIVLDSVVCDDHYRQGMSVISVVGLRVVNSTFSNTNGTPPSSGVDFEPVSVSYCDITQPLMLHMLCVACRTTTTTGWKASILKVPVF